VKVDDNFVIIVWTQNEVTIHHACTLLSSHLAEFSGFWRFWPDFPDFPDFAGISRIFAVFRRFLAVFGGFGIGFFGLQSVFARFLEKDAEAGGAESSEIQSGTSLGMLNSVFFDCFWPVFAFFGVTVPVKLAFRGGIGIPAPCGSVFGVFGKRTSRAT